MTKKTPITYPFTTKNQIVERIRNDDNFVVQCLQIVGSARTNDLLQKSERRGFMASHARQGNALCEALKKNGSLNEAELNEARTLIPRYAKQIACVLRRQAIQENPELAKVAEVFSAK